MRNIGIDFGTCNLKGAARKKNGDLDKIKLGKSIDDSRIPNVILYEKAEDGINKVIGNQALKKPCPEQDKIRNIKSHLQEKEWSRELSFGEKISAYNVVSDIMNELYDDIHNANKNEDVAATITVPVNFSLKQRMLIESAAESAGFNVRGTITEPFAAVFYLMNDRLEDEDDHNVLIFDFGGGTLDLCIVSVTHIKGKTKIETKATIGITFGGNDINEMILDRIVRKQAKETIEKAIDNEPNIFHRVINRYSIMDAIDELKNNIFSDDEDDEDEKETLYVTFNDGKLAGLGTISVGDVYKMFDEDKVGDKIDGLLTKMFEDCDLTPDEITDVFMTGGTTSIPYFKKVLIKYFDTNKSPVTNSLFEFNDEMDRDERIYSSVSMGAVIYSEFMEDDDVIIKDKIPFFVYTKDSEGKKRTGLDKNSGCESPYYTLKDEVKQAGTIAVFQTIYGEEDKEVYLGDIELDDEIKKYATLYKLSLDNDENIVATFSYMLDGEVEPSDEWKKELIISL